MFRPRARSGRGPDPARARSGAGPIRRGPDPAACPIRALWARFRDG